MVKFVVDEEVVAIAESHKQHAPVEKGVAIFLHDFRHPVGELSANEHFLHVLLQRFEFDAAADDILKKTAIHSGHHNWPRTATAICLVHTRVNKLSLFALLLLLLGRLHDCWNLNIETERWHIFLFSLGWCRFRLLLFGFFIARLV